MEENVIPATQIDEFESSPDALEQAIAGMDSESIDEFSAGMDFEKFIVLNKKELSNFCRLVEPLTKASVDEYGKSVYITCVDLDTVELRYINNPYKIAHRIKNRSGKLVRDFAVSVSILKKITTSSFASVILVEDNDTMNLALCESLLYLETKPLKGSQYDFNRKVADSSLDKEVATYTFKTVGSILSCTDRASEKVAVIKNNCANFNTGIFASKSKSPFGESVDFVLFKQVSDIIGILAELSKVSLRYKVDEDFIVVDCDGVIYCEMPIGSSERVNDFLSPAAELALQFEANVSVINDTFLRLVSVVKSLEYLSNILTISFTKSEMQLTITTTNQTKSSFYKFDIIEGRPEVEGSMKLTAEVLQIFLRIVGSDVKYSFNENGMGIVNELGSFLIRKS